MAKGANKMYDTFPSDFENWHKYENPIEVKYALDKIDLLSESPIVLGVNS